MNDLVIRVTDTFVNIILSMAILAALFVMVMIGFNDGSTQDRVVAVAIVLGSLVGMCLMCSFWCVLSGIYKRLEHEGR